MHQRKRRETYVFQILCIEKGFRGVQTDLGDFRWSQRRKKIFGSTYSAIQHDNAMCDGFNLRTVQKLFVKKMFRAGCGGGAAVLWPWSSTYKGPTKPFLAYYILTLFFTFLKHYSETNKTFFAHRFCRSKGPPRPTATPTMGQEISLGMGMLCSRWDVTSRRRNEDIRSISGNIRRVQNSFQVFSGVFYGVSGGLMGFSAGFKGSDEDIGVFQKSVPEGFKLEGPREVPMRFWGSQERWEVFQEVSVDFHFRESQGMSGDPMRFQRHFRGVSWNFNGFQEVSGSFKGSDV